MKFEMEKRNGKDIVEAIDAELKGIVSTLDGLLSRNRQAFEDLYMKAPGLFYAVDKRPPYTRKTSEAAA